MMMSMSFQWTLIVMMRMRWFHMLLVREDLGLEEGGSRETVEEDVCCQSVVGNGFLNDPLQISIGELVTAWQLLFGFTLDNLD